jgi:hypothetical protein
MKRKSRYHLAGGETGKIYAVYPMDLLRLAISMALTAA